MRARLPVACCAVTLLLVAVGCADTNDTGARAQTTVLVAVASNFVATLNALQPEFEASTAFELAISAGSTGKLYAQIAAGAPYDVFLAADQHRPALLEQQGLAHERFSYAQGRLVVWSTQRGAEPDRLLELLPTSTRRIALANPALAPYGKAAEQTLAGLNILEQQRSRLVFGENVGQAHAMVATGNAALGFTALSYILAGEQLPAVAYQLVPAALYEPVVQDGIWLRRAANRPAVAAFVEFLQSPRAQELISQSGYVLPTLNPAGK